MVTGYRLYQFPLFSAFGHLKISFNIIVSSNFSQKLLLFHALQFTVTLVIIENTAADQTNEYAE